MIHCYPSHNQKSADRSHSLHLFCLLYHWAGSEPYTLMIAVSIVSTKCDECWHDCQLLSSMSYKIHEVVFKCLVALTFTFAASALGSVGHCSSVWASIQNKQLLWHSVVIAARAARQGGVWRHRREDREKIFTVMGGQCWENWSVGEQNRERVWESEK